MKTKEELDKLNRRYWSEAGEGPALDDVFAQAAQAPVLVAERDRLAAECAALRGLLADARCFGWERRDDDAVVWNLSLPHLHAKSVDECNAELNAALASPSPHVARMLAAERLACAIVDNDVEPGACWREVVAYKEADAKCRPAEGEEQGNA